MKKIILSGIILAVTILIGFNILNDLAWSESGAEFKTICENINGEYIMADTCHQCYRPDVNCDIPECKDRCVIENETFYYCEVLPNKCSIEAGTPIDDWEIVLVLIIIALFILLLPYKFANTQKEYNEWAKKGVKNEKDN